MNESNYKMHIILGNYPSYNYIQIQSRIHPKSLKFSWKSIPSNHLAMKYWTALYTPHDNESGMYYNTSPVPQKYTPMFEPGFLPLINNPSLRHPPPPDNDRYAMPAFPQERISHYTTVHTFLFIVSTKFSARALQTFALLAVLPFCIAFFETGCLSSFCS